MAQQGILLELGIMLVFSIVGYALAKRFKQPVSVGIIILGILLGPSVLGLIRYDDTIAVIAQLGSIILLFVAGLNSDIHEVFTKRTFWVALVGALFPMLGGFLVSLLFGYDLYASVFVGTTLTATCLGITTSVLKEIGKIKTESAKVMLGAAVIDDIISLSVLSIVLSVPKQTGLLSIGFNLLLVVGFVFVMLLFGPQLLTKLLNYAHDRLVSHAPKLVFVIGLASAFLLSYLAAWLGLAPIVGAFMAGVCFAKSRSTIVLFAGSEYLEMVFTSVFFMSIGIVVEIGAAVTLFWFILALTLVAIITKLIGSGYAARLLGLRPRDALIVGVGMAPRGEVAFIIALNGLLLGVISKDIYSAVVFMSFLTTVITLVLLKSLYGKDKGAQTVSEEVDFIDLRIRR